MRTVGYACAGMSVALIVFSLWSAGAGIESGMAPLLLALALLLAAVLTLGACKSKV